MMKVLNFGSLNYDYVYQVDHMLLPGETQSSTSRETFLGGKGFNQSAALARAGAFVQHAGCLGEDGETFLEACMSYGIGTDLIRTVPGPCGHTVIQVDKNAQNSILLFPGANRCVTKTMVDETLKNFDEGDYLLLQNEISELDYIIDRAYKMGLRIVINPAPFDSYLDACDFHKISLFIVNEIEGAMMTGVSEPEAILAGIRERYPQAAVVLTLGSEGAWYMKGEVKIFQKSFSVKAVDTTAAGDTFTGYFLAGLMKGDEIGSVLRRCAAASAITVTRKGAAPSIPSVEETDAFLEALDQTV